MSNSNLVNYTKMSPNFSERGTSIKKITIHHMAGNLTVETCGNVFASEERQASSTYGIGTDARVGQYVDESNRPWTSSSPSNDCQAVTIEVANDEIGGNWHVSEAALNKLILLCTDICRRNGIARLNYTGDTNGNLTMHKYFINTNCPGPYLESKYSYIADEVNRVLNGGVTTPTPAQTQPVQPTTSTGSTLIIKDASSWSVYPLGVACVKTNACGSLNPRDYGQNGVLEYVILDKPQANVVTIQTQSFGKVNIFLPVGDSEWTITNSAPPQPEPISSISRSYPEGGTFTFNTAVIVRTAPTEGSTTSAVYEVGDYVVYHTVILNQNGFNWVVYTRGNMTLGYLKTKDLSTGESYGAAR